MRAKYHVPFPRVYTTRSVLRVIIMDLVDVTDTPVGQRVEFANTAFIKSTFTRTSQAEGHIEARDPLTGRVVLKTIMNMNTGQEVPNWFDPTFWTIYVDGK